MSVSDSPAERPGATVIVTEGAAAAVPVAGDRGRSVRHVVGWALPGAAAAVALTLLHAPLAFHLWRAPVFGEDNQGLGAFTIVLAGVLAWQRREALQALPAAPDARGWWLVLLGGLMALAGHRLAMHFPLALSFPMLLAGGLWVLRGRRWVAELWFPLVLLLAITRIPSGQAKAITFPLQAWVTHLSEVLLDLAGVPFERSGLVFTVAGRSIEVSEGCSGWRSFTAAFWLFLVFVYWQRPRRWWHWAGLLPLILPAAVIANVLRVVTVVALAAHGQAWALQSPWHELLGLVYFIPVAWFCTRAAGAPLGQASGTPGDRTFPAPLTPAGARGASRPLWRLAAVLWLLCAGSAVAARQARALLVVPRPPEMPPRLGEWRCVQYEPPGPASLGEWQAEGVYRGPQGQTAWVVWQLPFAANAVPLRMVNVHLKHQYELVADGPVELEGPRRRARARLALLTRGAERLAVVATHLHPRRTLASDDLARFWRVGEQMLGGPGGPWVTLAVSTADAEQARRLAEQALPLAEEWLSDAADGDSGSRGPGSWRLPDASVPPCSSGRSYARTSPASPTAAGGGW